MNPLSMLENGVDGVLCGAQTHKCPKEGPNRSVCVCVRVCVRVLVVMFE